MFNKNRALYIFQYLWNHTDEEHPATTADIIQYLASIGISTTRKTVAEGMQPSCRTVALMWSATAAGRTNTLSAPAIWSLPN